MTQSFHEIWLNCTIIFFDFRYFVIGSAVLMEANGNCESVALLSFKKGKKIIENNLARALGKELSCFDGDYAQELLQPSFLDQEEVLELKSIIKDMAEKVYISID